MAETLTFEISYLYQDSVEGIAIPVTLVSANGIYNTWAKVDTGAEVCLFSNEVGLRLGLDIERGLPKTLGSTGGTKIESFGHEVMIQTFGIAMVSVIYFAKYSGITRNLLGRLGWLRNLQLGLRDYDNKLFISEYAEAE
ncbi:MAG: aspartyl protease family protein [Blastocatellia bacterium]